MDPVYVVLGILACFLGVLLFRYGHAQGTLADVIAETPTTPICGIRDFGRYEVKGVVECDRPLLAPVTSDPCVWYRITITETYVDQSHGRRNRSSHRTQVVRNDQSDVPFRVKDDTGVFTVFPSGATVYATEVENRTERPGLLGSLLAPVGSVTSRHTFVEAILIGSPIYVLGEVQPSGEGNAFRKGDDDSPFVVSVKSEEELLSQASVWAKVAMVAGGLLAVGGVASTLYGWTGG